MVDALVLAGAVGTGAVLVGIPTPLDEVSFGKGAVDVFIGVVSELDGAPLSSLGEPSSAQLAKIASSGSTLRGNAPVGSSFFEVDRSLCEGSARGGILRGIRRADASLHGATAKPQLQSPSDSA